MNSESRHWGCRLHRNTVHRRLLKSLPTSVEVGNSFADFCLSWTWQLVCRVYIKSRFLKKSAPVVDFSISELGKWFAEFALKIIIPYIFFNFYYYFSYYFFISVWIVKSATELPTSVELNLTMAAEFNLVVVRPPAALTWKIIFF